MTAAFVLAPEDSALAPEPAAAAPVIRREVAADAADIEALLDHAFGPGRFAKASERVREFAPLRLDLSFCAEEAGRLVGCVRQSEIVVGETPMIFLGPLAVAAPMRRFGLGARLVEAACAAAGQAGYRAVLLVGDPPFFGKLGFSAAPPAGILMPGPVDRARLLLKPLTSDGDRALDGGPLQGAVAGT